MSAVYPFQLDYGYLNRLSISSGLSIINVRLNDFQNACDTIYTNKKWMNEIRNMFYG